MNEFALGGGYQISVSCDIRICSNNSIFRKPEVGLGIIPGFDGTQILPILIGASKTKKIIFTGQNIKAEESLIIGLVNAIYPQKELISHAKKLAKDISKNSMNDIKNSKKSINEGLQVDIDEGIQIEEKYFNDCLKYLSKIRNGKFPKKRNF